MASTPASCPYSTSDVTHDKRQHRFTLACADGGEAVLSYTGPVTEGADGVLLPAPTYTIKIDVPESATGHLVEDLLVVVARNTFEADSDSGYADLNMSDELRATLRVADGAFTLTDVVMTTDYDGVVEFTPWEETWSLDLGEYGTATLVVSLCMQPVEAMNNTTQSFSSLDVPESKYLGVGDFMMKCVLRNGDPFTIASMSISEQVAAQVSYTVDEHGNVVLPAVENRVDCVIL